MSFRLAILGGAAGAVFLVSFLFYAGLALPISLLFVAVYLCCAITLARLLSTTPATLAAGFGKVERAYTPTTLLDMRRKLMDAWADYCAPSIAVEKVTPLRRKA